MNLSTMIVKWFVQPYWNGIDKSNVRWVIHYNLPKHGIIRKLVGRDGLPSETVLFESYGDVIQLQNLKV
jgi:ATP-dependent DNA helicase RecQ